MREIAASSAAILASSALSLVPDVILFKGSALPCSGPCALLSAAADSAPVSAGPAPSRSCPAPVSPRSTVRTRFFDLGAGSRKSASSLEVPGDFTVGSPPACNAPVAVSGSRRESSRRSTCAGSSAEAPATTERSRADTVAHSCGPAGTRSRPVWMDRPPGFSDVSTRPPWGDLDWSEPSAPDWVCVRWPTSCSVSAAGVSFGSSGNEAFPLTR